MNPKIVTTWQRIQVKKLRALFDHAQTLPDPEMRKLALRLLHLTEAVEALPRKSASTNYVANLISGLESEHLK